MFDVQVVLLNDALFEVKVLRLNCSGERGRIGLGGKDRKEAELNAAVSGCRRGGVTERAQAAEVIGFGEIGRFLQEALGVLIPRGIVIYGIFSVDCSSF